MWGVVGYIVDGCGRVAGRAGGGRVSGVGYELGVSGLDILPPPLVSILEQLSGRPVVSYGVGVSVSVLST